MIKGNQREQTEFTKQIGIAEFNLVDVSPDLARLKEIYPNSTSDKEPNYCVEKTDEHGTYTIANVVLYIKDQKGMTSKTNILLTSRQKISKEETDQTGNITKKSKYQYINNVGNTVWAESEDQLKALGTVSNPKEGYRTYVQNFLKKPYRIALQGEELLYDFAQKLTRLDTRDPEAELVFNTKKIFAGDFRELQKDLVNKSFETNTVVSTYEIVSKRIDAHEDEVSHDLIPESWKHYQSVYNRFLPGSYIKSFEPNKTSYPKYVQAWVDQLTGANGSKNFFAKKVNGHYLLELAREYNESENPLNAPTTLHEEVGTTSTETIDDLPF